MADQLQGRLPDYIGKSFAEITPTTSTESPTGCGACATARSCGPTWSTGPRRPTRLQAVGAADYLTKPLDVARFLEVIDRVPGTRHDGPA